MDGGSSSKAPASPFQPPKNTSKPFASHDRHDDANTARVAANLSFSSSTEPARGQSSLITPAFPTTALIAAQASRAGLSRSSSSLKRQALKVDVDTTTPVGESPAAPANHPLIAAQISAARKPMSSERSRSSHKPLIRSGLGQLVKKTHPEAQSSLLSAKGYAAYPIPNTLADDSFVSENFKPGGNQNGDGFSHNAHLAANIAVLRQNGNRALTPGNGQTTLETSAADLANQTARSHSKFAETTPARNPGTDALDNSISASTALRSYHVTIANAKRIFEATGVEAGPHANATILSPKPIRVTSPLLENDAHRGSTLFFPSIGQSTSRRSPPTKQIAAKEVNQGIFKPNAAVKIPVTSRKERKTIASESESRDETDDLDGSASGGGITIEGATVDGSASLLALERTSSSSSSTSSFVSASDHLTYESEPSPCGAPSRTQSAISLPRSLTGSDQSSSAAIKAFRSVEVFNSQSGSIPLGPPNSDRWLMPNHTGDSMRYAIAASSLASSRGPSPAKGLAMPSTSPRASPSLRITLREAPERRNSSPSKSHSANEFRRQLQRYLSLWSSNRGLYTDSQSSPDGVVSVVVRDIYSRSRLPLEVLESIWSLVDTTGRGWLTREGFCIGLYLIDNSLSGMKLPARISDNLWASFSRTGVYPKMDFSRKKGKRK